MPPSAAPASPALLPFVRGQDLLLPVALLGCVAVILVPLPAGLMDVLLAGNVSLAVLTLLTAVYVLTPLEFSIFPSLLLGATLARLVLNVAITRLILTRADADGLEAAGGVVRSFGQFVAGDDVVVGIVIFVIILVIQFVVITKGSTRISEVAARFALDGMPGRQMAIDADLSAGLIDEREAQRRRTEVTRQADFYGAMDGASKFVRGDAVAALVITVINIVGGLSIGIFKHNMGLAEASSLYTKLTIGDGLVSQVPALLTSLAAGLLVTRSTTATDLPREFLSQLLVRPRTLALTSGFLGLLIFTNLPKIPLALLGLAAVGLALRLTRQERQAAAAAAQPAAAPAAPSEEKIENFLAVDPMELEIGRGLIRLADPRRGGDLLERVQRVRQRVAAEIGIILPKVRIRDNMRLAANQYRIKISDAVVAEGTLQPGRYLAIESAAMNGSVPGTPAADPVSGTPAVWIDAGDCDQAEGYGYRLADAASVLTAHLTEVVGRHADEILTRDGTKHLVEQLRQSSPAVVDELIPGQLKLAEVQTILQMLLRERVPVRHLGPILEALGDYAPRTREPAALAELVRQRLARVICARYRDEQNRLRVVTLDPALEEELAAALEPGSAGAAGGLARPAVERICRKIATELD
ncbi:MAG: FHIPEP family type III secretion protein, partial [Planctomycetaceae bacterium]|nr:FHIPEP family type III secretion protein [Planctomycetaceae bacterium]